MTDQTVQASKSFNDMLDEKDLTILKNITDRWIARGFGPRVGDFVYFPGEEFPRRFNMATKEHMQTTVARSHPCNGDASFHITSNGYADFSGSLDHPIPIADLVFNGESRTGTFWFWHHGMAGAHRGVTGEMPCRVYRYRPKQ